jgi:type IV pilus assembly protein PilA
MFCFKCGASMPDDAKICPQCATPVESIPAPPPVQAAPPPPAASQWLNVPPAQAQYPPQSQPYPGQGQPYGQQPPTDGKATASLVLGILSLVCFGILAGIPAIILGHVSRGNIKRSMGRLSGSGMALAGLIMGYVSICITLLIVPAIVLPNLLRSRISANESAAASTVRTINTTQITYSTQYPDKGYAPDLATLGPGTGGSCDAEHACLLDNVVANPNCTNGAWCTKSAYRFILTREGNCGQAAGTQESSGSECNYVVVATPVSTATGRKSFCSTADAVVRYQYGMPLSAPITAEQCSRWFPIS